MLQLDSTQCYMNKLLSLRLYGLATLLYVPDTCSVYVHCLNVKRIEEVLLLETDQYLQAVMRILTCHETIVYSRPKRSH